MKVENYKTFNLSVVLKFNKIFKILRAILSKIAIMRAPEWFVARFFGGPTKSI